MNLSKDPVAVTDHACLKYIERQMGLNVELVRRHIFGICATPAAFGCSSVRAEGVRFIIHNMKVITVTPDTAAPNKTSQQRLARETA